MSDQTNKNPETEFKRKQSESQTYFIIAIVFVILGLTNFVFLPVGIVFVTLYFSTRPEGSNLFDSAKPKKEPSKEELTLSKEDKDTPPSVENQ